MSTADDMKPPALTWASIVPTLLQWAMSQGISAVLLLTIIALMAYTGDYAFKVGIPHHIEEIQKGYDKQLDEFKAINKEQLSEFRSAQKEERDARTKEIERISTSIDKLTDLLKAALEKIERPYATPKTPPISPGPTAVREE